MNKYKGIVRRCDPGIRETVRLLLAKGFPCTDSGDGVTKLQDGEPMGCALTFPHVWMTYTDKGKYARDILRLEQVLKAHPVLPVSDVVVLDAMDGAGDGYYVIGAVGGDWEAQEEDADAD